MEPIYISAWEALTNGISTQLQSADIDATVWKGADGSIIIGDLANPEELTCEYTDNGTVAEYLQDR